MSSELIDGSFWGFLHADSHPRMGKNWFPFLNCAHSCLTPWKISRGLSDSLMDSVVLKSVAQMIKAIKTKQKSLTWLVFEHVIFTQSLCKFLLSVKSSEGVNKSFQENKYIFKINNKNARKKRKICSKLTIKTLERHHWLRFGDFIVSFKYSLHIFLVFLLWTLNMYLFAVFPLFSMQLCNKETKKERHKRFPYGWL